LTFTSSALPDSHIFEQAVQVLENGGIVAYPTETYYGLAVDPENIKAVAALYRLKGREPEKALSYLIPDEKTLFQHISAFPAAYKTLSAAFWPGPLTLVFYGTENYRLPFKSDDKSLAFRISSHPIAHKLCCLWGGAITASSANISGNPALSSAEEVKKQWGGQIDYVLDGGKTQGENPSTIVRCNDNGIEIIRSGAVTEQEIRNVLPASYTICKSQ